MAVESASPVCLTRSADGGDGGRAAKKIKLFGSWILSPVTRDSPEHEEGNRGGPQLQEEEERKLLEQQPGEEKGGARLKEGEQPRKPEQRKEHGEQLGGEEDDDLSRADGAANSTATPASRCHREPRDRSKANQWTMEEHIGFLLGLAEKGKGNWKDISREFVKTRTPTQVATHAQKFFLRQAKPLATRHRSSIFDLTLETEPGSTEKGQGNPPFRSQSLPELSPALQAPATPQPRPSPPPPRQPTPSAVKVAPLCSEGSLGVRVGAPVLRLAPYPAALALPFFTQNGVLAPPALRETSGWPALSLKLTHSFSAPELHRGFCGSVREDGDGDHVGHRRAVSWLMRSTKF